MCRVDNDHFRTFLIATFTVANLLRQNSINACKDKHRDYLMEVGKANPSA